MTKIIWNKPFAWANFESNSKSEQLPSESKLSQVTRDLDRDNSKSKWSMNRGVKPFENDPRAIRITAIASYFESNSKSQQSPSSTIRIEAITSWSRLFDLGTIHQGNRIKLWNRIRINRNQENQNQAYTWRSRSMVMAKEFEFKFKRLLDFYKNRALSVNLWCWRLCGAVFKNEMVRTKLSSIPLILHK